MLASITQIFDERVRRGIEAQLARRGFEQVTGFGVADLLVHYHASLTQQIDLRKLDRSLALGPLRSERDAMT